MTRKKISFDPRDWQEERKDEGQAMQIQKLQRKPEALDSYPRPYPYSGLDFLLALPLDLPHRRYQILNKPQSPYDVW